MNVNMPNILKIEKLLNDSAYSELIEFSANFNTRLCVERKLRLPFLDPQTGVAQKHSNLYMKRTQRMPGMRDGQIYTYPSLRWKNKSNSLKLSSRPFFRFRAADNCSSIAQSSTIPNSVINSNSNSNSQPAAAATAVPSTTLLEDNGEASDFQALIDESNSMTGGADTDSKDSSQEVVPKEWYYDDMNDNVSEEQPDSDFDYNINGYKRKKKVPVRKGSRKSKAASAAADNGSEETPPAPKKSRSSGGRSAGGGSSRRSKKGTSSRSNKSNSNNNNNGKNKISQPLDIEPPSFDSVQDDLKLNDSSADSFAYRKFLN